jgi:hypothetical protein
VEQTLALGRPVVGKRGEAVRATALKPIDLGAVKERLASIEVETAANDPKKLRAELALLRKQLAAGTGGPDPEALKRAQAETSASSRWCDRSNAAGFSLVPRPC